MEGDNSHREVEEKEEKEEKKKAEEEKEDNGSGNTRDEFRRHRFELDERAFSNEESEDSIPGSEDSSSTEESDHDIEPSQETGPVLGVPAYSPKLHPRRVLGYPIHSLVSVRHNESSMSIRILVRALEVNPRATFLMFAVAFILPWLCFAVAFYALPYAGCRGFDPD